MLHLDPETLNEIGTLASIAGLGTTLAQWFQGWRSQANKEEKQATIGDYLEWLRRENHEELVTQITASQETQQEILGLLETLGRGSAKSSKEILDKLQAIDTELHTKFTDLTDRVDALRRDVQLFTPPDSPSRDSNSIFSRKYLQNVADQLNRLTVLGVSEMRHIKQPLDLAYVSLNLKADGNEDKEPERAEGVLLHHSYLIVRGQAGSGKSTLLSWIALQCAKSTSTDNPWSGGIPFLIPLRRLDEADGGRPNLLNFAQYTLDPALSALSPPEDWIDNVLKEKSAVVLLDGVDELPAPLRPAFWDWLANFSNLHPGNRIYVTSRPFPEVGTSPQNRLWSPPPDFATADLHEMNDGDVRMFITNWTFAN